MIDIKSEFGEEAYNNIRGGVEEVFPSNQRKAIGKEGLTTHRQGMIDMILSADSYQMLDDVLRAMTIATDLIIDYDNGNY